MANQGIGKMHLDLYTSNSALTHKAKFWCNYVGALKGNFYVFNFLTLKYFYFGGFFLSLLFKYDFCA